MKELEPLQQFSYYMAKGAIGYHGNRSFYLILKICLAFPPLSPMVARIKFARNLPADHRDSEVQNANEYHGRTDDESTLHYYNAHRISLRVG